MAEKANHKVLIGARTLKKQEIEKILPTYDMIFNQIETMRSQVSIEELKDNKKVIQKTNSFGILGKRGTGKTSILYTIKERLETEHQEDIVLPVLVPDNMSLKSDIMGAILGMLLEVVNTVESQIQSNVSRKVNDTYKDYVDTTTCRFKKQNKLRMAYDDVVKMYCYVQPDYRELLIKNYTDLSSYVSKSGEVLNAESEFRNKFDKFLCILLEAQSKVCKPLEVQDKSMKKVMPLVHIFIDDIDLNPQKCPQIAKVLLAYLSHPAIVVHISGDLETFEEALTVEFLGIEKGNVTTEILNTPFVADKSLLARKKDLAYEYLKKIIPPMYRHNLSYWNLKTRGNYSVVDEETGKELTLQQLLIEVFGEEKVGSLFTRYIKDIEGNVVREPLPLAYHIFDETSRGLNNVYNALVELKEVQQIKAKDSDEKYKEVLFRRKKAFIQTIISSSPKINAYKDVIEKIILWGNDEQSTKIRLDNLQYEVKNVAHNKEGYSAKCVDVFMLFELVYVLIKILPQVEYNQEILEETQAYALFILLVNPIIHESTVKIDLKNAKEYKVRLELQKDNSERVEIQDRLKGERQWVKYIKVLMIKNDFTFALHYYEQLIHDIGYNFFEEAISKEQYVVIFAKTLEGYAPGNSGDVIQKWWNNEQRREVLNIILEASYLRPETIVYKLLLERIVKELEKSINQYTSSIYVEGVNNIEYRGNNNIKVSKEEITELISQSIYTYFTELINKRFSELISWNEFYNEEQLPKVQDDNLKVLDACCKGNIWSESWSGDLINKNIKHICNLYKHKLVKILNNKEELIIHQQLNDNIQVMYQAKLNRSYGGEETIANQTVCKIQEILGRDNESVKKDVMSYRNYIELYVWIRALANNNRVSYGQFDARNVLKELNNISMNLHLDKEEGGQDKTEEVRRRIIYYLKYLIAIRQDISNITMIAKLIADINDKIQASERSYYDSIEDQIRVILGKDKTEKIDIHEILGV